MIFSALFTVSCIIITTLMFFIPSSTTPSARFGLYDTFAMWVFTFLMIRWTIKRALDIELFAPNVGSLSVLFVTSMIGIFSGFTDGKGTYDINGRVALAFFLVHAGLAWPSIKDLLKRQEIEDDTFEAIKDGELPNDKEDLVKYMQDDVIDKEEGQKILDKQKKEAEAKEDASDGDDKEGKQSGGARKFIKYAIKRGSQLFRQIGGDDDDDGGGDGEDPEYAMPSEDEADLIEEASTKKKINALIAENPYINARTTVDAPLIVGWLLYVIIEPLVGTPTMGPFVNMWHSYGALFKNLRKPTNLWGFFCQFKWAALIFTLFTLFVKILTMIPVIWILKMIGLLVLFLAIFFYVIEPVFSNIVYPILSKAFSGVTNMVNVSFLGTGGMMGGLSNSLL